MSATTSTPAFLVRPCIGVSHNCGGMVIDYGAHTGIATPYQSAPDSPVRYRSECDTCATVLGTDHPTVHAAMTEVLNHLTAHA